MDNRSLREKMVKEQILARGIKDQRVIKALYDIPRQDFIPDGFSEDSYADHPVPIGKGQTISQPYIVALMTSKLEIKGPEKVLEIGTGSGYQTAVLAEICSQVVTVEREEDLFKRAREVLTLQGYTNIDFILGDGTLGFPEKAPFDRIIVTAGAPKVPGSLLAQLKDEGKMILPVGDMYMQRLVLIKKNSGAFLSEDICVSVFVPLKGSQGS